MPRLGEKMILKLLNIEYEVWSLCYAFHSQSYSRVHIYTHWHRHQCNWTAFHIRSFVRPFIVTLFRKFARAHYYSQKRGAQKLLLDDAHAHHIQCINCTIMFAHLSYIHIYIYIYLTVLSSNENPCTTTNEHAHMLLCVSYSPNAFYPNPNANRISHIRCGERMESRANNMNICSLCINWVKIHAFFQRKFHTQTSSYAPELHDKFTETLFVRVRFWACFIDLENQPFGAFKVLAWQNQIWSQKQGEQSLEYKYRIVKWHLAKLYSTLKWITTTKATVTFKTFFWSLTGRHANGVLWFHFEEFKYLKPFFSAFLPRN